MNIFDFILKLAISSCMLKPSGSRVLHTNSINVVFFNGLYCLVLRTTSYLDAFSTYSLMRSCAACFITTAKPEASEYRSSRTRYSFHSDKCAPCRYHTNCLTYILKTYVSEIDISGPQTLICLRFCFVWTIPSPNSLGDQRVNNIF